MARNSLIFLLLLEFVFVSFSGCSPESEVSDSSVFSPIVILSKSNLPPPPKNDIALVVNLDGTAYFVNESSREIMWSRSLGLPIYSSHQDEANEDMFLDFPEDGDDQLYWFSQHRRNRMKFTMSMEDFFVIYKQSTITARVTTIFEVDEFGGLIRMRSDHSKKPVLSAKDLVGVDKKNLQWLHITRTDFTLKHFETNSEKIVWNLTFANFEAIFKYPGNERGGDYTNYSQFVFSPRILHIRHERLKNPLSVFEILSGADYGKIPPRIEVFDLPSAKTQVLSILDKSNGVTRIILYAFFALFLLYLIRKCKRSKVAGDNLETPSETVDDGLKESSSEAVDDGIETTRKVDDNAKESPTRVVNNGLETPSDGRKIGKMIISKKTIGQGNSGTTVLEGTFEGRPIAIKRLLKGHHDIEKEIKHLFMSDCHQNIIRLHGSEEDENFIYLCLERCACSLDELISLFSDSSQSQEITMVLEGYEDLKLWKDNGYPTLEFLKLMRGMVFGVDHLHQRGIIHRDLKPTNILIQKEGFLAKVSDMGISKQLPKGKSSITNTGSGSSGWQAPEQLEQKKQTVAVDLFSLGLLIFHCVNKGKLHPYGDFYNRDGNILADKKDLWSIQDMPEAFDLCTLLLEYNPELRPAAKDVVNHPFFWSPTKRLTFLRLVSDWIEGIGKNSPLMTTLEKNASAIFQHRWDAKLNRRLVKYFGAYRSYNFKSVRDLLRVIRNLQHHYWEHSADIQAVLGSMPDGFDDCFSKHYPELLIRVYRVMQDECKEEEFWKPLRNVV